MERKDREGRRGSQKLKVQEFKVAGFKKERKQEFNAENAEEERRGRGEEKKEKPHPQRGP